MVFFDDIEVYLKPAAIENRHEKFPELELPFDHEYGACCKRCFVPYRDGAFWVVLRFTSNFNMYSASAIQVGVGIATNPNYMHRVYRSFGHRDDQTAINMVAIHEMQRSRLAGQQTHIGALSNEGALMVEYNELPILEFPRDEKDAPLMMDRANYYHSFNPGAITVTIQRGHVQWKDEDATPSSGNPYDLRDYKPGTFKRLKGINGLRYRFEFRPRSHDRLVAVENTIRSSTDVEPLSDDEIADQNRYKLIADADFVQEEIWTRQIRAREYTTYSDVQAMKQEARDLAREAREAAGMQIRRPLYRDKVHRTSKVKLPRTCDCPLEAHVHPAPRAKSTAGATSRNREKSLSPNDSVSTADNESTEGSVEYEEPRSGTADIAKDETGNETSAKTCTKCQNFKRPPRGKKLAWRQEKQRWMYVHHNAPDEEGPVEDEDDDESLSIYNTTPRGSLSDQDSEGLMSTTISAPSTHSEQDATNSRYIGMETPAIPSDNLIGGELSKIDADAIPPSAVEMVASSTPVNANEGQTYTAAPEFPMGLTEPEGEAVPQLNAGRTSQISSPVNVDYTSQHNGVKRATSIADSKKRPSTTDLLGLAAKKTCFDIIDLTSEDDDLIEIKQEDPRIKGVEFATTEEERRTKALEMELNQARAKRRNLELEMLKEEEAEIEAKLAEQRSKTLKGKSSVVIKIED